MKIRPLRLLLLLPLLGMKKCENEQPEPTLTLPPVTQTGANTLGFLVDGRVWITYGSTCFYGAGGCAANTLLADYSRRWGLDMHTYLSTPNRNESFNLQLDSLVRIGSYPTTTYYVPGTTRRAVRSFWLTTHVGDRANETSFSSFAKGSKASITITRFDTVQRIIAGTFEGTLRQNNDSTKRLHVTDGRFDVHYR